MSFRKLLRQWFSSARRPLDNKRRSSSARAKGRLQLERLEDRLVPATISDGGTSALSFALAPSENLTIVSNGSTYTFTSNLNFTNGGVVSGSDFSGFLTKSLTLNASGVSRYTTSGFLRMKLGQSLEQRGVPPHIFESAAEAQQDLHHLESGTAA